MSAIGAAAPPDVDSVTPVPDPLSSESASTALRLSAAPAVALCTEVCAAATEIAPVAFAVPTAARPPAVAAIPPAVAVRVAPGPAAKSPADARPVIEPPAFTPRLPPLEVTEPMRTSPVDAVIDVAPLSASVPTRRPVAIALGPGGTSPVESRVTVEEIDAPVAAAIRASVALSICAAPPAVRLVRMRNSSRLTSAKPLPSVSVLISVAAPPAVPVPR